MTAQTRTCSETPPARPKLSLSTCITPTTANSAASTPTVATPSNTSSSPAPRVIAIRPGAVAKPAPISKMAMASVISPNPATQLTMTTKEWVIPPRPKPGRKPATDTPPTKRKAQNRAAQRAFRERRAARVGELEEQMEEQMEEHARKEREFQERIRHLEADAQALRAKCQWLENTLEKERRDRAAPAGSNPATPMGQHGHNPAGFASGQHLPDAERQGMAGSNSATVAGPRPIHQPFSISQIISPLDQTDDTADFTCGSCEPNGRCACVEEVMAKATLSCGKCTLGTNCSCLDESLRNSTSAPDLKRPHPPASPSVVPGDKRHRPADPDSPLETDFTAMFSQKKSNRPASDPPAHPQPQPAQVRTIEPKDHCGFCNDGTYCICADSMNPTADNADGPASHPISHQTQTPPPENDAESIPTPMEITSTGAIKLPSLQSLSSRGSRGAVATTSPPQPRGRTCGPAGPGTCAQCISDPKSGLFCRSLAANFEQRLRPSLPQPAGSCGGGGGGGCCKQNGRGDDKKPACRTGGLLPPPPASSASGLGLTLSCADAYKTLSSHRHFGEAANDIGNWLPRLRAAPAPPRRQVNGGAGSGGGRSRGSVDGLAPIEVEAASIMSVLKGFDVRFGQ